MICDVTNIDIKGLSTEDLEKLNREITEELRRRRYYSDSTEDSFGGLALNIQRRCKEAGCKNLDDVYNLPPEKLIYAGKLNICSIPHVLYTFSESGYDYESRWDTTEEKLKDIVRQVKKAKKEAAATSEV